MKKLTQKALILLSLKDRYPEWIPSHQLQKNAVVTKDGRGWLGSSGQRVARTMASDGLIERKRVGKYAYYRMDFNTMVREHHSKQLSQQKTLLKIPYNNF